MPPSLKKSGGWAETNALAQSLCGMPRDSYRGWSISFDFPPIPMRDFDWSGTHHDYDCDCDQDGFFAVSGAIVHGRTRDDVIREIDLWIEENEA